MRKLINETKRINLNDLIFELQNSNKLIVYYRSRNERNGLPVFLKKTATSWHFISPVNNYAPCYEHTLLLDTLKEASKNRDIYVIDKDESDKLFKLQIEIDQNE